MGAFGAGLAQGMTQGQAMMSDLEQRKQQAELFRLKSKQMQLETDMTEKQLKAQGDLQNLLFKGPDMQQVESQGPGAPMQLPMELSDNPTGLRDDARWGQELKERGPGAFTEGPRPAPGQAPVPGTEGVWANLSPQLQSVAKSILTSTGGDPTKTMQTLEMLAPGVFPKQPMIQKLGEGETLQRIDPNTGKSQMLAQGNPKYHAPHAVAPGGTLIGQDGKPIFTAPDREKQAKPKDDIVEVGGMAYQVSEGPNGQKTLTPMQGQEDKADESPKNPVDQYIFANSPYKNMAEAKKAGAHDLVKQAEMTVREQRPMERAKEVGRALTAELPVRERQKQEIALEKPLAQEKRANLFDRKAFLEGKNVRLPPGTSEGAAAKADVIEITDKQMADIQTLDNATSDMGTLFSMGDRLITAKDWKEANFKQFPALKGGSFTGFNSEAATYEKDVQAFSTNLARAFGHEKGVMTDQDIARWVATIPTFRDTVKTKEAKKSIFNEIKNNALKAQRRAIAGDDLNLVRSELQQKVQPLLKKADAMGSKIDAPPVPEKFKHLPKEDQERWQQAYMERMQEMGAQ
jgi:hypothetical protein